MVNHRGFPRPRSNPGRKGSVAQKGCALDVDELAPHAVQGNGATAPRRAITDARLARGAGHGQPGRSSNRAPTQHSAVAHGSQRGALLREVSASRAPGDGSTGSHLEVAVLQC